jgi:hypothetical protein
MPQADRNARMRRRSAERRSGPQWGAAGGAAPRRLAAGATGEFRGRRSGWRSHALRSPKEPLVPERPTLRRCCPPKSRRRGRRESRAPGGPQPRRPPSPPRRRCLRASRSGPLRGCRRLSGGSGPRARRAGTATTRRCPPRRRSTGRPVLRRPARSRYRGRPHVRAHPFQPPPRPLPKSSLLGRESGAGARRDDLYIFGRQLGSIAPLACFRFRARKRRRCVAEVESWGTRPLLARVTDKAHFRAPRRARGAKGNLSDRTRAPGGSSTAPRALCSDVDVPSFHVSVARAKGVCRTRPARRAARVESRWGRDVSRESASHQLPGRPPSPSPRRQDAGGSSAPPPSSRLRARAR